jgi:hypothetical protein
MLNSRALIDYSRMANYLFQIHQGHIIINVEGRPYLLDSGAPFSVGYEPIRIGRDVFPVEYCYLGVTCSYLSEHIGVPIEGMIGADILREYNVGVYAAERMVQFNQMPAAGEIVMPVHECCDLPIIHVRVNGRVRRMFFDTGAPISYLLPEALEDVEPEGRHEDFYPLLGNFLTNVYTLDVELGGNSRCFRFGEVPEALRPMLEVGDVQGMIGTELLLHFGMNLSLRDKVMRLESPHSMRGYAFG